MLTAKQLDRVLFSAHVCKGKREILIRLFEALGFKGAYEKLIKAAFNANPTVLIEGYAFYGWEVRGTLIELFDDKPWSELKFLPFNQYDAYLKRTRRFGAELSRYKTARGFLTRFPADRVRRLVLRRLKKLDAKKAVP